MYNRCSYSSIFSKHAYVLALSLFCASMPLIAMDQTEQSQAEFRQQPTWLFRTAENIYNSPLIQCPFQVLMLLAKGSQPSFTIQSLPVEPCDFFKNIDQRISRQEPEIKLKEAEKEKDDGMQPIQVTTDAIKVIDYDPFAATHYYRNTQLVQSIEKNLPQLVQSAKQSRLVTPVTLISLSAITGRYEFGYIALIQGTIDPIQGLIESGLSLVKTIKMPPHSIPQSSSNDYDVNQHLQHQDSENILISTGSKDTHIQAQNNQPEKSGTLTLIKESGKTVKGIINIFKEVRNVLDTANPIIEKFQTPVNEQPLSPEQRVILSTQATNRMQSMTTTAQHTATALEHFASGLQSIEHTLNSPTAGRTVAQVTILSALGLGGVKLAYNKLSKDKVDKKDAIIAGIGGSTAVISLLLTWQIMQTPCSDRAMTLTVPMENVRT